MTELIDPVDESEELDEEENKALELGNGKPPLPTFRSRRAAFRLSFFVIFPIVLLEQLFLFDRECIDFGMVISDAFVF